MSKETNFYLDGEDKQPRRLLFIIACAVVGIILITVVSCSIISSQVKNSDNNLSNLYIDGNSIEITDTLEYDYNTVNESVSLKCVASNAKATVRGCDSKIDLVLNDCINKEITVISEGGKEKTYKLNICRYDSEMPVISNITSNPATYTSGAVEVTVALDENAFFQDGVYSFDGGKTWQKENSIKVTENKKLEIVLKNKMGITSNAKEYIVNNIDKTEPIVLINSVVPDGSSTYNSAKLTATVTPSSTTSGYKYEWYVNNNPIGNSNSNSYNATTTGSYKVKVTTGAGKEAFSDEYKVTIQKEPSAKIVISDSNVKSGSTITKNVTLTAKIENGTASKVTWFQNGIEIATGNSYTVNASKPGKYELKYSAQLTNGYSVTSQTIVLTVASTSPPATSTVTLSVSGFTDSSLKTAYAYKEGKWTNTDVYVVASAKSSGSTIKSITFEGYKSFATSGSATLKFNSNLNKEIVITAVDNLGTKATKKYVIRIDKTAPYTPNISNSNLLVDYDCFKEGSGDPISNKKNLNYDIMCITSTNSTNYPFETNDVDTGGSGINYCEIVFGEDDSPLYGSFGEYVWDFTDNKQKNLSDINWVRDYNYRISTNPKLLKAAAIYFRRCRDNAGNIGTALKYLVFEKY